MSLRLAVIAGILSILSGVAFGQSPDSDLTRPEERINGDRPAFDQCRQFLRQELQRSDRAEGTTHGEITYWYSAEFGYFMATRLRGRHRGEVVLGSFRCQRTPDGRSWPITHWDHAPAGELY